MKRVLGGLLAALALVGLGVWPAAGTAAQVGWFTRNPAASAPEGGLQVANGLDGVVSFGAVRAGDGEGLVTTATLTLTESGQAVNASGGTLQACPAAGTWKPGQGALADGPKADCAAGSVPLARDAATSTWSGDVASVLATGVDAIAVVPGDAGGVFQISFAAPKLDVTTESTGRGTDSSFDASEFSSSSGGSSDAFSSSTSSSGEVSSSPAFSNTASFSTGSPSGFTPSTSTITPTETAIDPAVATAEVPAQSATAASSEVAAGSTPTALRPVATVGQTGSRAAKFFFFLLTAAVIGAGAGIVRNRVSARLT